MFTKYFLVFLLGLAIVSTATTTEHGGSTTINERRQMPLAKRFYSRGWATIGNQPSESIEKSHEQPELMPTGATKTMQRVEEKTGNDHDGTEQAMQNTEEMHRDKATGCLGGRKNKNAGIGGGVMPENKPTSVEKPDGHRPKTSSTHGVEDMNQ